MIDPVYKRLLAENAWLRQQIAQLQEEHESDTKHHPLVTSASHYLAKELDDNKDSIAKKLHRIVGPNPSASDVHKAAKDHIINGHENHDAWVSENHMEDTLGGDPGEHSNYEYWMEERENEVASGLQDHLGS